MADIKVIKVDVAKAAEIVTISDSLESLQHEVEGYIECIYPWEDNATLICNEEGKINGMELNRPLYDEDGRIVDIIAGPFLIVGFDDDGELVSLTDEQIATYLRKF